MAELLGVSTAIFFAIGHAFVRAGSLSSNVRTATLINTLSQAVLMWVAVAAFASLKGMGSRGAWFFVLDGLLVPALARWFLFQGVVTLGMSRAASLSGTVPLFSFVIAAIFLKESFTPLILTGTTLVVAGIIAVSYRAEKATWAPWMVSYPFIAALIWALSPNIRKVALGLMPYPLLGSAISSTTSVLVMLLILAFTGGRERFVFNRRSVLHYALSGLAHGSAIITYIYALQLGKVVVVVPLANSIPLFSMLIAFIFWKKAEGVNLKTVLGALLIVLGAFALIYR